MTEDGLLLLAGWARDGLTDKQIAKEKLDISPTTFYDWKNRFPEFENALKRSKEIVDTEVENSLEKSAKGYYVTIKKPIKVKRVLVENGVRKEYEEIKMVEEEQYIPPNVTAQIFWLKNRRPKKWRDKPEEDKAGGTTEMLKNIQTMADIMKHTVPSRNIEDYE